MNTERLTFGCGCPKAGNTQIAGKRKRCLHCYREYQNGYRRENYTPSGPPRPAPRFELVSVQPISEAISGRSYHGSGFPLKQRRG